MIDSVQLVLTAVLCHARYYRPSSLDEDLGHRGKQSLAQSYLVSFISN